MGCGFDCLGSSLKRSHGFFPQDTTKWGNFLLIFGKNKDLIHVAYGFNPKLGRFLVEEPWDDQSFGKSQEEKELSMRESV